MALGRSSSNEQERPVLLVICDYYLPGFESGGAMRTLVNMVDRLSGEFDFRIITRDHDGPLNRASYSGVTVSAWNKVRNAEVYYLSKGELLPGNLKALINDVSPDAIYLNSFFSPLTISTLILKRLKRIHQIPIILAPEGEFSPGALALKIVKKRLYILSAKLLGILTNIIWKAASDSERRDINEVLGTDLEINVAPNMPPRTMFSEFDINLRPAKMAGSAKMVFLSRYMRKKNFNWLLRHLHKVTGTLQIDICGPIEEAEYWEEAKMLIAELPGNVRINLIGPVPHDQVLQTLFDYHFFVLPTLGENFGHVFIEALAAGCPLIASDRTPWRQLQQKGIGWDLSLDDPDVWIVAINKCVAMDSEEYVQFSQRSRDFAAAWLTDPELEASNLAVLRLALK